MVANNMKINSELLPVKHGDGVCSIESKNSTTDPNITPVPINSGDEQAIGQYCAVAIGNATSALAENAFTCGKLTKATQSAAVAMGRLSEANGRYSTALNEETQANAQGSLSTGYSTIANGNYSAAFGHTTCANKTASIAEGAGTWTGIGEAPDIDWDMDSIANGSLSHVGGYKSNTMGKVSFAHGVGLQTTNTAETALGQYNVSNNGTLFSVGNGSSVEDKSNAFDIRYGKFAKFDVDGSGTKGQQSNGNWKNLEGAGYDLWTIFRTRTHTQCYKTSGYCPLTERKLNLDRELCKQIVGISFIEPVRHATTMYLESPNTLNDSDENSWKQFANYSMDIECRLSSGEVRQLSNYEFSNNAGAKKTYSVDLSNGYRAWPVEIPKDATYIEIYIFEGTANGRVELSNIYLDNEDKVIVGIGEKSLSEDDIVTVDDIPQVIDNLTSYSTIDALSANQGRVLKEMVDAADKVYIVDYANPNYTDAVAAFNAGKLVVTTGAARELRAIRFAEGGGLLFETTQAGEIYNFTLRSNSTWIQSSYVNVERYANKVTSISAASTDTQYPSAKAVFDLGYVEGVISQTQTWAADGLTYTMTDIVRGAIPKHFITAFIELTRVPRGLVGTIYEGAFDSATGYFSLNGLTDISYEEAIRIYNAGKLSANKYSSTQYFSRNLSYMNWDMPRTLIYDLTSYNWSDATGQYFRLGAYSRIESICGQAQTILNLRLIRISLSTSELLQDLRWLWIIDQLDVSAITSARTMTNAKRLQVCNLFKIAANWSFPDSSLMEAASVAYMINYATSGDKTITLHATAYARAIADDDVQAALEAHPNVTLASA